MNPIRILATGLLLVAGATSGTACAAQSYDSCAGFIDTLPATISTQGVWCLRKDLSTAISSGVAITIAANNVTLDCNDFKIGGLAAGNASRTIGIYAGNRQNASVRHCNVRGFYEGIKLLGDGHLVEDNRLDQNLSSALYLWGENNLAQRNRIFDTGGAPGAGQTVAVTGGGTDFSENIISGVFATGTDTGTYGILSDGQGVQLRGNQIRGLTQTGAGPWSFGIQVLGNGATVADNRIVAYAPIRGTGIYGTGNTFCTGNTVAKFEQNIGSCQDAGENASN